MFIRNAEHYLGVRDDSIVFPSLLIGRIYYVVQSKIETWSTSSTQGNIVTVLSRRGGKVQPLMQQHCTSGGDGNTYTTVQPIFQGIALLVNP